MRENLLDVENLTIKYKVKNGNLFFNRYREFKAIDQVSFNIGPSETLGLVGESGCGKSSLARAIVKLVGSDSGKVTWLGKDWTSSHASTDRKFRENLQLVFQDPLASLNPRMTVSEIISEPLENYRKDLSVLEKIELVKKSMETVGLSTSMINRYPHEFSGGQCQRIGIARAIILKPKLIICDEPVSALDVSIQAQVINLLKDLQKRFSIALLFISHDLSVVKHISDRVMVLYLGRIMEIANVNDLFSNPSHPYSQALLSAIPIPDPIREKERKRDNLVGDAPSPIFPPSGCVFRTRCKKSTNICSIKEPREKIVKLGHRVACHHVPDEESK